MRVIDPKTTPPAECYQYLVSTVNPRPIAFVSTIDAEGNPNLAPYSFFNCFSSNPPILVFSANRRIPDRTKKDTLHNLEQHQELVINMVPFRMVRQMAVASISFPPEVNEFEKSGLTPIPSDLVKPFRVAESPVHFECTVQQILPLGDLAGSGHLIVCEVLRMHLDEAIFDDENQINPHKLDLMGRMGRAYYVRASGEAIHKIFQDQAQPSIGFDQLPLTARRSTILTGNNLGQLAGLAAAPTAVELEETRQETRVMELLHGDSGIEDFHRLAQTELSKENTKLAGRIVWLAEEVFG